MIALPAATGALRGALALSACIGLATGVTAWALDLKIPDMRERPANVAPLPKAGEPCERCGVVTAIREVSVRRPVNIPQEFRSNPGYSGPGGEVPVGAVIYVPFGAGTDKPYIGGVGTPEMQKRLSETQYDITVRLDDGADTVVRRSDGLGFRVGDRVRVTGLELQLLVP